MRSSSPPLRALLVAGRAGRRAGPGAAALLAAASIAASFVGPKEVSQLVFTGMGMTQKAAHHEDALDAHLGWLEIVVTRWPR